MYRPHTHTHTHTCMHTAETKNKSIRWSDSEECCQNQNSELVAPHLHLQNHYVFPKFFIVFQLRFGIHVAQTLVDMKIDIKSHVYDAIILNERNGGTWMYFLVWQIVEILFFQTFGVWLKPKLTLPSTLALIFKPMCILKEIQSICFWLIYT